MKRRKSRWDEDLIFMFRLPGPGEPAWRLPVHRRPCTGRHELLYFVQKGRKLVRNRIGWWLVLRASGPGGMDSLLSVDDLDVMELQSSGLITVHPFHAEAVPL